MPVYDPDLVQPMRDEVARLGVEELKTGEDVDKFVASSGVGMIFVNSVCGCAASSARPGLALAMQSDRKPGRIGTVFAGMDEEATARARSHFSDWPPSSPQFAFFKDGEAQAVIQRHEIETQSPDGFADMLKAAFDHFCAQGAAKE